jgi:signal transduction histidine kinase
MAGSLERCRFQLQLGRQLEQIDDSTKLFKTALSRIVRHLPADAGAVVLLHPITGELRTFGYGRDGTDWDGKTVRAFLALERPVLPDTEIMAPIVIGNRPIGVMALRRAGSPFADGDARWVGRICRKLAHEAALREERRLNRVADQIRDRTVRELRPKDLFYQILHGLRSLTRYDHSSALLIAEEEGARLVLHAEQIAWMKAKSRRIGQRIRVPDPIRMVLRRAGDVFIVSLAPAPPGRRDEPGDAAAERLQLARLLRFGGKGREPAEGTVLIAPLHYENQLIGVLKIAARRAGAFGAIEAAAVARVVPHVVSVMHNARRALSMEERIIAAEKKHAMADLARAISHDVKNAIGAILPTAQQAREEVTSGSFRPEVLAEDLRQIEQSAQICQRIFDGMLQLARSEVRPVERAPLATVIDGALTVLGTRMKRLGIELEIDLPDDLPDLHASRGGLEQLFLNLITNAIEAMSAGGRLRVRARARRGRIEVQVSDTGTGIPQERLDRIQEPFYTTKDEGFGLGLSICRSILWENGGTMELRNRRGGGTTVTVTLPAAGEEARGAGVPRGSRGAAAEGRR